MCGRRQQIKQTPIQSLQWIRVPQERQPRQLVQRLNQAMDTKLKMLEATSVMSLVKDLMTNSVQRIKEQQLAVQQHNPLLTHSKMILTFTVDYTQRLEEHIMVQHNHNSGTLNMIPITTTIITSLTNQWLAVQWAVEQ